MSGAQDTSTGVMNRRHGRRVAGRQRASVLLAASASVLLQPLLSGCTFGEHYAIIDREAEPADAPPSEPADTELYGVDVDSIRFAAE